MPFQNTLAPAYQILPVPVLSIDAGPDRFSICALTVSLVAVVELVVDDPTQHQYQWVQMSGDPVIWDTPQNAFTVTYTATGTTDVTIRIYADRDTAIERFDDVVIFGTPSSVVMTGMGTIASLTNACRAVSLSFLTNASAIGFLEPISSYKLSWNPPSCDANRVTAYLVQLKAGAGQWITFAVLDANDPLTAITPNSVDLFRVLAVYADDDNHQSNWVQNISNVKAGILSSTVLVGDDTSGTIASVSGYVVDDLTGIGIGG